MKTLIPLYTFILILYKGSICTAQNYEDNKNVINKYLDSIRMEYLSGRPVSNLNDGFLKSYDFLNSNNQLIENGVVYTAYFGVSGSPFLSDTPFTDGKIIFNNTPITGVRLLYDIFGDNIICLVTTSQGNNNPLIISDIQVSEFTIYQKQFINLTNRQPGLTGYYELIYQGKNFKILAKWKKEILKVSSLNQLEVFSDPQRTLYIVGKNGVFKVKRKKEFSIFFNKEKSANKIKKVNYKFPRPSKATNEQLIELSQFFDN